MQLFNNKDNKLTPIDRISFKKENELDYLIFLLEQKYNAID